MLHLLTLSTLLLASNAAPLAQQQGTRNVAILVFEGVELLDFAGPGEVFAVAGHGAFNVFTVAETKAPLTSERFLTIVPRYSIDDCPAPDILVIPGGDVPASNARLQGWIAGRLGKSELIMSVCNGAALLAASGALGEREATTHHNTFDQVLAFAPDAAMLVNRRFVDHGEVMTSGGISAGIDGSLHVVSRLLGAGVAQATASHMEYNWQPEQIAALHAKPGIRYDGQAERVLSEVREHGIEGAAASYVERVRAQSETDHTEPSEYRLRSIASELVDADRTDDAITVLEFTIAAWKSSYAQRDLEEARKLVVAKAAGDVQLVYSCPPCGGACDGEEHAEPGNCSSCGMALQRRVVEPAADGASAGAGTK